MYKIIVPVIISSCLVGCGGGSSTGKEDNNTSLPKPTVNNKPTTLNDEHKLDGLWVFDNNKFAIHTSSSNVSTLKVIETMDGSAKVFGAEVSELDDYIEFKQNDRYGNLEKTVTYKPFGAGGYVNVDDANDDFNVLNDNEINISSLKLLSYLVVNRSNVIGLEHKNYNLDFVDDINTYCKVHIDISHMKNNLFQITGSAENCNDVKNNGQVSGFAGLWIGEDGEPHFPGYITLNNNKSLPLYGSKLP
ncbi:hypothetical protein BS333_13985 [Vibrio azureus]|uniref:Uncharacterized protein n=1 Tax=Vibrio azureus NBRC 104587 TaxID=1219077 RepID=U3C7R3_9VIBR|nr:hypothetical protein [Vibrio azureus]AUI87525.1 hypothetical protein BS333_13985 [Vibrio azureus]GAD74493.1 hypothetical protein VAZ01S_011_00210 [Vibrio azureus NBRC 104587]